MKILYSLNSSSSVWRSIKLFLIFQFSVREEVEKVSTKGIIFCGSSFWTFSPVKLNWTSLFMFRRKEQLHPLVLRTLNRMPVASSTSLWFVQILWNQINCDLTIPLKVCLGWKLLLCKRGCASVTSKNTLVFSLLFPFLSSWKKTTVSRNTILSSLSVAFDYCLVMFI